MLFNPHGFRHARCSPNKNPRITALCCFLLLVFVFGKESLELLGR